MLGGSKLTPEDCRDISHVLCLKDVCYSYDAASQSAMMLCLEELALQPMDDDARYNVFFAAVCASSLCPEYIQQVGYQRSICFPLNHIRDDPVSNFQSRDVFKRLSGPDTMYKLHTKRMLSKLVEGVDGWTSSAHETMIVISLIKRCGRLLLS